MKITAQGGGGFAGITQRYEVDTQASPAGSALEAAIASSDFFTAPVPPAPTGADMMRWTITVVADGRQRTVTITENGSQPWQKIIDLLRSAG